MTTAKTRKAARDFRLPDPPPREPEDMTSAKHLAETGNMHYLKVHLGNTETTIVKAELFLVMDRRGPDADVRVPDLLVSFDADPELYERNNGYVVSEQGKPPDFVLEIASRSTREVDNNVKREFYARHGVLEYWRFDEEDSATSVKLAGDRLIQGEYEPIVIRQLGGGGLQGHSEALNLDLRWERGQLLWIESVTNRRITTLEDERQALEDERQALQDERQARQQAESRVEELEAELRRLREG